MPRTSHASPGISSRLALNAKRWDMRKLFLLTACMVCLCLSSSFSWAGNWPRFRGPNGQGSAGKQDLPTELTEQNLLWKVPIPGRGHSSPIVWDQHLFLQTASDDGSKRFLLWLDTSNGKTRWSRSVEAAKAHTHLKNSLASASAATVNGFLFLFGMAKM